MSIFTPIQQGADLVTYQWLGMSSDSHLGSGLNFFIYDSIKIGLLLLLVNYVMAITRYYFPVWKARQILTQRRWYGLDYVLAALLGVVTPFCSCSSIPLFVGFILADIPLGVTFAFLISSPLINESSLYVFPFILGWKVTILYNLLGMVVSVLGGMLIDRLNMEKYLNKDILKRRKLYSAQDEKEQQQVSFSKLLRQWSGEAWDIFRTVYPYVLLGVGVGAMIHGLVPESLITAYLSSYKWWVIPMAVVMGAPLYANSMSIIPIAEALIGKGIPVGTVLAFMTATVTISIPELLILSKLMKKQLLFAFLGITLFAIILMGYVFNLGF